MAPLDAQLLDRWRDGDSEAFAEIVRRYSSLVFQASRRVLGDPHLAEDVAQDCFLTLLRSNARPQAPLGAWLHRVATNRALSLMRSRRRRARREEQHAESEAVLPDPAWREARDRIDSEIEALPDELRLPVIAALLEGRAHEDIAAELGVPRRTISYRIQKGSEEIRRRLEQAGIRLGGAAIAAALGEEACAAVPKALLADLGRMAILGPSTAAPPVWGAKVVLACLIAGVMIVGGALLVFELAGSPPRPEQGEVVAPLDEEPASTAADGAEVARAGAARQALPRLAVDEPAAELPTPSPRQASPSSPVGVTLAGSVRDREGRPIAGVDVLVQVLAERPEWDALRPGAVRARDFTATRSDRAGRWALRGFLEKGRAVVIASRDGFADARRHVDLAAEEQRVRCDLELAPGHSFRARILDMHGQPVMDAVVSVLLAYGSKDRASGQGFALTDESGWCRLGFGEGAEHANLRVNSESAGQEIFLTVPLDAPAVLTYRPRATLRGRVTPGVGETGSGLRVHVSGEVPEPELPVMYTGLRPRLVLEVDVDGEGRYGLTDVQPGIPLELAVVTGGAEDLPFGAGVQRLTTADEPWTPFPGEVKEWSPVVDAPRVVRGIVRTESGRPAGDLPIWLEREGTALWDYRTQTDEEGRFEMRVVEGPGTYSVVAGGLAGERALDRAEVRVPAGGIREVELAVRDPFVLRLHVVDADGQPVESVSVEVRLENDGAPRLEVGRPLVLEGGRGSLQLFGSWKSAKVAVSAFPRGPSVSAPRIEIDPDRQPEEIHLRLPRAIDFRGYLVDAQGQPVRGHVTLRVSYEEGGGREAVSLSPNEEGRFEEASALRPGLARLTISGEAGTWTGERMIPDSESPFELGEVMLR